MQASPVLGIAKARGRLLLTAIVLLTSVHGCLLPELGVIADAGSGGMASDGSGGMGGDAGDGQGGSTGGGSVGGTDGSGGNDEGSGGEESSGGADGSGGGTDGGGGSGGSGDGGSDAGGGSGGGGGGGSGGTANGSPGCGKALTRESGVTDMDVEGTARRYHIEIPLPYKADTPYPLVFAFHSYNSTYSEVLSSGHYGMEWEPQFEAIYVAPNGLDAWTDADGNDSAMVEAIRAQIGEELCVDEDRIFAIGYSAGGTMAYRLGCGMADTFDGIAVMSGVPLASTCADTGSVPVWSAHGESDDLIASSMARDALDPFLSRNGCSMSTSAVEPAPCVAFAECEPDAPVHFCLFDGGHEVPSFTGEAIWNFFLSL